MSRRAAALGIVALIGGCAVGPDYVRPTVPTPESWQSPAEEAQTLANLTWWQLFQDPQLQKLIEIAVTENKDLLIAVARIDEARARYGITRADLFPSVAASADGQRARTAEALRLPTQPTISETYSLVLDVPAYELDLWGRLRRLSESARADLLAQEESRRATYLALVAEVARVYLLLRDLDARLEIARQTLAAREESLRLTQSQLRSGVRDMLDVRQAEGLVARARVSIADTERQISQTENNLSVLLGRNPGPVARGVPLGEQQFPPQVPAGLPSELLARRPDILAAEQQLVAENANIGAAKAAFFPSITLTGYAGYASTELSDLFNADTNTWAFAPRLYLPLFTGGRLTANLELAEARAHGAVLQYEKVIQTAFREVEDALVEHGKRVELLAATDAVAAADRERLRLTRLRYVAGVSSFFEVLDAERQLFDSEITLVQSRRAVFDAVVQLYQALGGGWSTQSAAADLQGAAQ